MASLPHPYYEARAIARIAAARARTIAELADQFVVDDRQEAITEEERDTIVASFDALLKELQSELDNFRVKCQP